jgi:uncharacterized protein
VLNQPAYELWRRFQNPQTIAGPQFKAQEVQVLQEMARVGLLLPQGAPDFQPTTRNWQLSVWLHLTDRCNLRCSYCYLPHVREDMSLDVGRAAIEAAFRSAVNHGHRQIKLKYAGGEPLLQFSLIKELHPYAQRLAAEKGLELGGVVLSNGTLLTEAVVADLRALGLRLMISLDGIDGWHNMQRSYASGRGSFDDVASAVKLALANGLMPDISITVSGRNAAGLPEIVGWVLEHNLPFGLNFYRLNDFSIKHEDLKLEEERIITGMLAAFEVIEANPPQHSLLASLIDRANLAVSHEYACSAGQDYLVFDQNGRVAKCQMMMHQPVTDIHAADPLVLIREDQSGLQNFSVKEKEGCQGCQWKYWCAGGCPLETYRTTGRYDVRSPNCNIYKALYPEALRLEGLRLLKYQAGLSTLCFEPL